MVTLIHKDTICVVQITKILKTDQTIVVVTNSLQKNIKNTLERKVKYISSILQERDNIT